jgi:hypothetical protein
MTTPLLLQSAATSLVVYLELQAGGPADALTHTDVTAALKKEGGSFAAFALTALNFTNLGDGFYEVDLTSGNTDTLGSLYLTFIGSTVKHTLVVARVALAAAAPASPPAAFVPDTTTIFGYIYDGSGAPEEDVIVAFRTVSRPTILHPDTQGLLLTEQLVTATTDSSGFFTKDLVTGAQVEVVISAANYRRVLTVPGATANLFDIP